MDSLERQTPTQDWDPFSQAMQQDPLAVHAELRARCPVAYSDRFGGFWALTKYADIAAAARDTGTFVSSRGTDLPDARTEVPKVPLQIDPPAHAVYRKILQPYFNPGAVKALEPVVRGLTVQFIEPLLARGRGDIVRELTYPLPTVVLCAFLHLPQEDWPRLKSWADEGLRARAAGDAEGNAAVNAAMSAYIRELMAARRAVPLDPKADMVSGLLAAEVEGRRLDDAIVHGAIRVMLTAGHETTTSALGNAILRLAQQPELQTRLRANPQLLPAAIEEFLRYESPVQALARTVTRDVEIRGRQLTAGDYVALLWASANRDQDVFPDAHRCLIDRTPNRHVAFGYGIHKCLGADLARLELRLALEELLGRTAGFAVDGQVQRTGWPLWGVASLPLSLTC